MGEHEHMLLQKTITWQNAKILELQERNEELENGDIGFNDFVNLTTNWLKKYPPDIFNGSSGDAGPVFTVAIRTAINALCAK